MTQSPPNVGKVASGYRTQCRPTTILSQFFITVWGSWRESRNCSRAPFRTENERFPRSWPRRLRTSWSSLRRKPGGRNDWGRSQTHWESFEIVDRSKWYGLLGIPGVKYWLFRVETEEASALSPLQVFLSCLLKSKWPFCDTTQCVNLWKRMQ